MFNCLHGLCTQSAVVPGWSGPKHRKKGHCLPSAAPGKHSCCYELPRSAQRRACRHSTLSASCLVWEICRNQLLPSSGQIGGVCSFKSLTNMTSLTAERKQLVKMITAMCGVSEYRNWASWRSWRMRYVNMRDHSLSAGQDSWGSRFISDGSVCRCVQRTGLQTWQTLPILEARSRVHQKLIVAQLVNKFHMLSGLV